MALICLNENEFPVLGAQIKVLKSAPGVFFFGWGEETVFMTLNQDFCWEIFTKPREKFQIYGGHFFLAPFEPRTLNGTNLLP